MTAASTDPATCAAPAEDRTTWVISDGKAGHEGQCVGVAEALGVPYDVKRVAPGPLARAVAPWGPSGWTDGVGRPGSRFSAPWPTFVLATGRQTIPYIRAIKRRAGLQTYAVILMDPKIADGAADLIWVPEHDRRRGRHVVTTPVAPHRYSDARLIDLRHETPIVIRELPHPRLAVLIGGPNGDYTYLGADVDRLIVTLKALIRSGAGLMITPSRRTPRHLAQALEALAEADNVLLWRGDGAAPRTGNAVSAKASGFTTNPYPYFLANADAFIITADSVSMICEAAATGRPVHTFNPSGGSDKFGRFHRRLQELGVTRPLDPTLGATTVLDNWSYPPLSAAPVIAADILQRWEARRALVPELLGARP